MSYSMTLALSSAFDGLTPFHAPFAHIEGHTCMLIHLPAPGIVVGVVSMVPWTPGHSGGAAW